MLIDTIKNQEQNSSIVLQTINPRPIAWIVTQNRDKIINIAPYSLFTPLSFDPISLIISFRPKEDKDIKDTLKNIRQNGKCTICMVNKSDQTVMHQTSKELLYNVSEALEFNIKTEKIVKDYPPIISSSSIAYFCDFDKEIELKDNSTIPVILNVKEIFIDDTIVQKDKDEIKIEFNGVGHIVGDRYI